LTLAALRTRPRGLAFSNDAPPAGQQFSKWKTAPIEFKQL